MGSEELMLNINQHTEFLSQDQQQLDNSAMMPASSIRPIRGRDDQKPHKGWTKTWRETETEEGKKMKNPNKEEKKETALRTLRARASEDKRGLEKLFIYEEAFEVIVLVKL